MDEKGGGEVDEKREVAVEGERREGVEGKKGKADERGIGIVTGQGSSTFVSIHFCRRTSL